MLVLPVFASCFEESWKYMTAAITNMTCQRGFIHVNPFWENVVKYMCNYICNMYVILKRSIDRMFADGDRGLAFYIYSMLCRVQFHEQDLSSNPQSRPWLRPICKANSEGIIPWFQFASGVLLCITGVIWGKVERRYHCLFIQIYRFVVYDPNSWHHHNWNRNIFETVYVCNISRNYYSKWLMLVFVQSETMSAKSTRNPRNRQQNGDTHHHGPLPAAWTNNAGIQIRFKQQLNGVSKPTMV